MCELLGMSSNRPSTVNLSISTLASHGAGAVSLRDGWGVAYSEGPDVRLIKDPGPASDSDWLRFLGDHSLRSNIVIAHIRTATMGARAYRNTQPFIRELGGRVHFFAHNGSLPHIFEKGGFDSAQFTPIGDTDSERAYCGLLDRLRHIWRPRQVPGLQERLSVVSAFAEELRTFGPANFLYSDGDVLFAHGHRRLQASTTKVEPPGLVYLHRLCPGPEQSSIAKGLTISGADQSLTLVASVPLNDEPWTDLGEGEVLAIPNREAVARHQATI